MALSLLIVRNQTARPRRWLMLAYSTIWLVGAVGSAYTSSTTAPMANFEPSWIASGAHGTIVATAYARGGGEIGIMIFLRNAGAELPTSETFVEPCFEIDGLRCRRISADADKYTATASRWTLLGQEALCCMTGFAPDVDGLMRQLQKYVDDHVFVYDASKPLTCVQLTLLLATQLRQANMAERGRPYGVQALLIGASSSWQQPSMYTLDPSGAFRHWGRATAIGRHADVVRTQLGKLDAPRDAQQALETLVQSCTLALQSESAPSASDLSFYQALHVHLHEGALHVATIDAKHVNECLERASRGESKS